MTEKDPRKVREINVRPTTPLSIFFGLGDKVTKGDPVRKANFDYYMLWIILLAFFFVFLGNLFNFFVDYQIQYLGWSAFALAVMWFQYSSLSNMWKMREAQKDMKVTDVKKEEKIENVDEMLKSFEK